MKRASFISQARNAQFNVTGIDKLPANLHMAICFNHNEPERHWKVNKLFSDHMGRNVEVLFICVQEGAWGKSRAIWNVTIKEDPTGAASRRRSTR